MRSMMEPNSDVQDLTGEPRGSGPPAAGTPAHAVKKRSILSEGSELIAEDQGVEMALEASWLATLRVVGLAPEGGGEGAESGGCDEGGAAAGDESDSDSSLGLGLE